MTAVAVADAAYLVAAVLFILSLAGLSRHETSRGGVLYGIAGMVIALAATIWLTAENALAPSGLVLMAIAVLIGATIGLWRARVVQMTGMPQLIALLHSFVGLAIAFLLLLFGGSLERRLRRLVTPGDPA